MLNPGSQCRYPVFELVQLIVNNDALYFIQACYV